jgi:serine/threonine-protein kinase
MEIGPEKHRFCLIRKLGGTEQGSVWLATDLSLQAGEDQFKVLKFLVSRSTTRGDHQGVSERDKAATATAESTPIPRLSLNRLRSRVERMARLDHPNIVKIYGWRHAKNEPPFMEMEYMDHRTGFSLERLIHQEGRAGLGWKQTLQLLQPAANALDYAHQQHGLIHRNLKSANIFVTDENLVKIMDFDLIYQPQIPLGDKDAGQSDALASSAAMQLGFKQDIVALAALVYEMLTGKPPYQQDALMGRDARKWPVVAGGKSFPAKDTAIKLLSEPAPAKPTQLSEAAWRLLQHILSSQTETTAVTASGFMQSLEDAQLEVVAPAAPVASPPPPASRPAAPPPRAVRQRGWLVAIPLIVALLGGAGTYLWFNGMPTLELTQLFEQETASAVAQRAVPTATPLPSPAPPQTTVPTVATKPVRPAPLPANPPVQPPAAANPKAEPVTPTQKPAHTALTPYPAEGHPDFASIVTQDLGGRATTLTISRGMSTEQLLTLLGKPLRIINEGGRLEEWVYRQQNKKLVVYVREGQVDQLSRIILY